ncbi:MAG: hypothetical protein ACTSU2_08590 [Promethearchaeota archaeon]
MSSIKLDKEGSNRVRYIKYIDRIKEAIEEFFEFIVWESISQILIELPGNISSREIGALKETIKSIFTSSVLEGKKDYSNVVFKEKIETGLKKFKFVNKSMQTYLKSTLSIFRLRLIELYSKNREKIKISDSLSINLNEFRPLIYLTEDDFRELKIIINRNVLVSYMDKIVLSSVIRTLLYSVDVSFAEIYEFRVHLLESFRALIDGVISLKEIRRTLDELLINLSNSSVIRNFISASIFGYISIILRSDPLDDLVDNLKEQINDKILIISDLTFFKEDKINFIVRWIIAELFLPILSLYFPGNMNGYQKKQEIDERTESQKESDGIIGKQSVLSSNESSVLEEQEEFNNIKEKIENFLANTFRLLLRHQLTLESALERTNNFKEELSMKLSLLNYSFYNLSRKDKLQYRLESVEDNPDKMENGAENSDREINNINTNNNTNNASVNKATEDAGEGPNVATTSETTFPKKSIFSSDLNGIKTIISRSNKGTKSKNKFIFRDDDFIVKSINELDLNKDELSNIDDSGELEVSKLNINKNNLLELIFMIAENTLIILDEYIGSDFDLENLLNLLTSQKSDFDMLYL